MYVFCQYDAETSQSECDGSDQENGAEEDDDEDEDEVIRKEFIHLE